MGEWIWVFLIIFLLFRFLLLAKKSPEKNPDDRSAGRERQPPPPRGREEAEVRHGGERKTRTGWRGEIPELANFLEAVSGVPPPRAPRPPRPERKAPPKPPPAPAPVKLTAVPIPPFPPEDDKPSPGFKDFDLPPLPRAIVWSEVLGTPKGLRFDSR